jgi:uncharacterized protein (DUF924 family)
MVLRDSVPQYFIDEKGGMKQLITLFLNEVMEKEAIQQSGAHRYERTPSRVAYRNGVQRRSVMTRYGTLPWRNRYCGGGTISDESIRAIFLDRGFAGERDPGVVFPGSLHLKELLF